MHVVKDCCKSLKYTPMHCLQELLQLEDRLGSVNRGAVQTTIERFTFPHKYKKVKGLFVSSSFEMLAEQQIVSILCSN